MLVLVLLVYSASWVSSPPSHTHSAAVVCGFLRFVSVCACGLVWLSLCVGSFWCHSSEEGGSTAPLPLPIRPLESPRWPHMGQLLPGMHLHLFTDIKPLRETARFSWNIPGLGCVTKYTLQMFIRGSSELLQGGSFFFFFKPSVQKDCNRPLWTLVSEFPMGKNLYT